MPITQSKLILNQRPSVMGVHVSTRWRAVLPTFRIATAAYGSLHFAACAPASAFPRVSMAVAARIQATRIEREAFSVASRKSIRAVATACDCSMTIM